jgi:hypothetical protein
MRLCEGTSKRERVIELLDELKSLICDDDWSDDDNDWDDKEAVDTTDSTWDRYNSPQWRNYAGALNALVNGKDYRLRLIGVDYEFDEQHTLEDVLQHEFTGEGYTGGVLIKPEISQDGCLLPEAVFTGISGTLYGAVLCSDAGLIGYVDLGERVLSGGDCTIFPASGELL